MDFSRDELIRIAKRKNRIIAEAPIGICMTDKDGYFELVNPAYCEIYGYKQEELIGEHFSIVTTEANKEELIQLYKDFIKEGKELEEEWQVKRKDGTKVEILANAIRLKGVDGELKKITFVIDITERKELERELNKKNEILKNKAMRDSLTNLYNHGEIIKRLDEEVSRAERENLPVTINILDIDNFTRINNKYGHVQGDKILNKISDIFLHNTREMDICGRYGGDEFLIIFPNTELEIGAQISTRIKEKIEHKDMLNGEVTISSGVATLEEDQTREKLIQKADELLYKAKEFGKNKICSKERCPSNK